MRLSINDKISVSACCYSVKDMDFVFSLNARNRGDLSASIYNLLRPHVVCCRNHHRELKKHPFYFRIKARVEKPSGDIFYLKPFYIDL